MDAHERSFTISVARLKALQKRYRAEAGFFDDDLPLPLTGHERPVECVTYPICFLSLKAAAAWAGVADSTLWRAMRDKRPVGGVLFRFVDPPRRQRTAR